MDQRVRLYVCMPAVAGEGMTQTVVQIDPFSQDLFVVAFWDFFIAAGNILSVDGGGG